MSAALQQHLERHHSTLTKLSELLEEEQRLLGVGDIDGKALEAIAKDKSTQFTALQENEQQRRLLQKNQGLGESKEGALKLAERSGYAPLWQETLELAQQVNRLNVLNGELIQHRLQHNQQMLNIIREAAGTPLYGADGKSTTAGSRLNSKA